MGKRTPKRFDRHIGPGMGLIIAGTDPVSTDMVTSHLMGIDPSEVPTIVCAQEAGLGPASLAGIEIRGAAPSAVGRQFSRPNVIPWTSINEVWGVKELS